MVLTMEMAVLKMVVPRMDIPEMMIMETDIPEMMDMEVCSTISSAEKRMLINEFRARHDIVPGFLS